MHMNIKEQYLKNQQDLLEKKKKLQYGHTVTYCEKLQHALNDPINKGLIKSKLLNDGIVRLTDFRIHPNEQPTDSILWHVHIVHHLESILHEWANEGVIIKFSSEFVTLLIDDVTIINMTNLPEPTSLRELRTKHTGKSIYPVE